MDTHVSPPRTRPAWLPPEGTIAARPAGQWWDAIEIDSPSAWAVLARLRELAPAGVGPVLCDPGGTHTRLTFLVPPGTAVTWAEPDTVALGRACYITIPGDQEPGRLDGLHWVVPLGDGPEHVSPDLLRQAAVGRAGAS